MAFDVHALFLSVQIALGRFRLSGRRNLGATPPVGVIMVTISLIDLQSIMEKMVLTDYGICKIYGSHGQYKRKVGNQMNREARPPITDMIHYPNTERPGAVPFTSY